MKRTAKLNVKTVFNQRRKMMRSSIRPLLSTLNMKHSLHGEGHEAFLAHELLTKRPEQLSVEGFVTLTNLVEKEFS